jgi:hypothetical protein
MTDPRKIDLLEDLGGEWEVEVVVTLRQTGKRAKTFRGKRGGHFRHLKPDAFNVGYAARFEAKHVAQRLEDSLR